LQHSSRMEKMQKGLMLCIWMMITLMMGCDNIIRGISGKPVDSPEGKNGDRVTLLKEDGISDDNGDSYMQDCDWIGM
jgi:hypothetical protein